MAVLVMAGLIALTSPASAGSWKYQVIPNDGHVLTYSEGDKVTFYLGCGRGFVLLAKYPGIPEKEGKARIAISTAKASMTFDGEFEEPVEVKDPVPMNFATEFRQVYLGYLHTDPRVYGKKWLAIRARLYTMLGWGRPLTISAGKSSYRLPPVDVANWQAPFEGCGLGGGW
jgi:hypothetical protein